MGNRRFAQVSTSDDEDDLPIRPRSRRSEERQQSRQQNNKRKRMKLQEDEDEEEEEERRKESKRDRKGRENKREENRANDDVEDEEDEEDKAKPVGDQIRVSGKGKTRRTHYAAFETDGNVYELEDPVLLVPEDDNQKPYVAIIKDISLTKKGMMVLGQWFYRPEEAEKKAGGSWTSTDTRELFYSFHRDEVPAESVMHKCVVHFVPIHKQLPRRKEHPGFIVRRVYDTVERKLWKLTDKDYEDSKQHEIDLLVQKTRSRLGDLPDIEPEDAVATAPEQEDQSKTKRFLRKKNISPLDVSREEESTRSDHPTPGSCTNTGSEYYAILAKFKALTGEIHRDKWLDKLLQGIQYMCNSPDSMNGDEKEKGGGDGLDHERESKCLETANGSQEKNLKSAKCFIWPDAAVPAVAALEKASNDALSSDFQKYNQKMRSLLFNLKNNALLAQRLLNGELEPSKILNMSPTELKEGLMAEETSKKESDDSERMQMTAARCNRCNELKVGVRDIIRAGHGDRYQLECIACGYSWYGSRDETATLTDDVPKSVSTVGTAPLATTKFLTVEKLMSPRESQKAGNDILKKSSEKLLSPRESPKLGNDVPKKLSEAYMPPVLEAQKSFSRIKTEDDGEITKKAE